MIHPQLDREGQHYAHFRKSMKKFTTTLNDTFSVVDYSHPYAFGRLNNDIIVLLSSLGITNEKLLGKQEEYFRWIEAASTSAIHAIDFLSCVGKNNEVERILLNGLDDPAVFKSVRSSQMSEISSFRKNDRFRSRMMIHKSRLIFGVCDPYKVLKEGQVHIRITTPRGGESTPINCDVLVVRNPCLHPG
jgi:regulator of nonsense transcripts 1